MYSSRKESFIARFDTNIHRGVIVSKLNFRIFECNSEDLWTIEFYVIFVAQDNLSSDKISEILRITTRKFVLRMFGFFVHTSKCIIVKIVAQVGVLR